MRKASSTSLSIYLAGETGTGKEVLAHLIHAWSERATGPSPFHFTAEPFPYRLQKVNSLATPREPSQEPIANDRGALLQAHGGTLFLDEVGDLSPEIQVKLLRFLENGEIRPSSGTRSTQTSFHPAQPINPSRKLSRQVS